MVCNKRKGWFLDGEPSLPLSLPVAIFNSREAMTIYKMEELIEQLER
ncbi:MAG: hypothetical protein GX754_03630 [Clostridiaceae bacterium]|nr:hypothetical protein [Clostridiaceae bacterium]